MMDVTRSAVDFQFVADIAASATAAHGIEDGIRLKVSQQVFNQIASAVAGIAAVTVVASLSTVIQAGEPAPDLR